jgi:hypothetical protein
MSRIDAVEVESSAVKMIGIDSLDDVWILPKKAVWAYKYEHQYLSKDTLRMVKSIVYDKNATSMSVGELFAVIRKEYARKTSLPAQIFHPDEIFYRSKQLIIPQSYYQVEALFSW